MPCSDFDYLSIGHLVLDRLENGFRIGGTAGYASRTALALGFRAAVVTSFNQPLDLSTLEGISIHNIPSASTTMFTNRYTSAGRVQELSSLAEPITPADIPPELQNTPLVHIGPVTRQVSPSLLDSFPGSFVGLTPQGWLRKVENDQTVQLDSWQMLVPWVPKANAVVLSREDLKNNLDAEVELAKCCQLLVVTDAFNGAFLYHKNRCTHLPAPTHTELDPTGCGDIFAAVFFVGLFEGKKPIQAARAGIDASARAVTRSGLDSVPTEDEAFRIRNNYLS